MAVKIYKSLICDFVAQVCRQFVVQIGQAKRKNSNQLKLGN